MPPITQPMAYMSIQLDFHFTALWRPPNHRRRRVVLTRLPLSFGLGQILAISPTRNRIVVPEDPSPLKFGDQELDYIGERAGHEGVGLELSVSVILGRGG